MSRKKQNKNAKFFVVGMIVICGAAVLNFAFGEKSAEPIPHRNLIDTKISQYSDREITQSAIAADPQFENIAFADPEPRSFFSNQPLNFTRDKLAAVVNAVKSLVKKPDEKQKEYGSWVWTPVLRMTPEYMDSIISDSKEKGVNTIYVSIDTYLDIFVMPKGPEREERKKVFEEKLADFIARANREGLSVDAEAGWRNWAEEGNTYKAFVVANFVKNFNNNHQNKFRGFQYDVEPYLMDSYEKNKQSVLQNFVKLIDQTENFLEESDLRFSVAIPDFYDRKDGMTPKFSYNGKKGFVFDHLLNILDRREGNSIIIMSYRNFADGEDGAIEISQNEMQTASKGAHQTRVIIAQETGEVTPHFITFNRMSKKYFDRQVEKINSAFSSNQNFAGIAVHYVNAFLALK